MMGSVLFGLGVLLAEGTEMIVKTLCFTKDDNTYLFRYRLGLEDAMVDEIMQMAESREHSLDWLDAATLSFQIAQATALHCTQELEQDSHQTKK